jgi:hypothetical protein
MINMSTTNAVIEWANARAFIALVAGLCIGIFLGWLIWGAKIFG